MAANPGKLSVVPFFIVEKFKSGCFQQIANNKEISYEKMGLYRLRLCS